MVITKNMLACLLNMDLELEYSAAIQYINHASVVRRIPFYRDISDEIMMDAMEEMQHAILLSDQIRRLGANPSVKVAGVFKSNDCQEILRHDLEDEEDTVRRYTKRIEQAEALGEHELAQHLRDILATEQEHLTDFKYKRNVRQRERNIPILEIPGSDSFDDHWEEQALKVPIRVRKRIV